MRALLLLLCLSTLVQARSLTARERSMLRMRGDPIRCGKVLVHELLAAGPQQRVTLQPELLGCSDMVLPRGYRVEERDGRKTIWHGTQVLAVLVDGPRDTRPPDPEPVTEPARDALRDAFSRAGLSMIVVSQ